MARKIHKLTRICCPDSNVQHLHVNKVAQQTLQRSPALRESVRHVALDDSKVCVQEANNTQLNLTDCFHANNIEHEKVKFGKLDEALKAYEPGQCDTFTSDVSQLYAQGLKTFQGQRK